MGITKSLKLGRPALLLLTFAFLAQCTFAVLTLRDLEELLVDKSFQVLFPDLRDEVCQNYEMAETKTFEETTEIQWKPGKVSAKEWKKFQKKCETPSKRRTVAEIIAEKESTECCNKLLSGASDVWYKATEQAHDCLASNTRCSCWCTCALLCCCCDIRKDKWTDSMGKRAAKARAARERGYFSEEAMNAERWKAD